MSETISGTSTQYLVDDLNPTGLQQVMDEIVGGSVIWTYAYGLQRISENQIAGTSWAPSFYGYDGHRNTRFLTNTSGTVTDTYQYDAFGVPVASTGTTANNYRYSGEWFDSNIGLYHLRARYYNQATGRFWARDPVEGKKCCGLSWNPYIFVKQNPVDAVDPTGREAFFEFFRNEMVVLYLLSANVSCLAGKYIDPQAFSGGAFATYACDIVSAFGGIAGGISYYDSFK